MSHSDGASRRRRGRDADPRGDRARAGRRRHRGGRGGRRRRRLDARRGVGAARLRDRRHPDAADEHGRGRRRGAGDPRAASRRSPCSFSHSTSSPTTRCACSRITLSALGYLLKDRVSEPATLLDALRRLTEGETVVDPAIVSRLFQRHRETDPVDELSRARARGARPRRRRPFERRDRPPPLHHRADGRSAREADLPEAPHRPGPGTNRRVLAVLAFLRSDARAEERA